MPPNFALLDVSWPEVARLIAAMVQAHDAVGHRTWSHPQEPTGEEWWADVLADPDDEVNCTSMQSIIAQDSYAFLGRL